MSYSSHLLFDIETLINIAQPQRILLIGNQDSAFLDNYVQQKSLLNQPCEITQINTDRLESLESITQRFDVGIAIDVFEHISKQQGQLLLSKLRDILCPQYCISLPISHQDQQETWNSTELFAFALSQVSVHQGQQDPQRQYAVYKYDIKNYKNTPDWLNADNWANPEMWNKYRW